MIAPSSGRPFEYGLFGLSISSEIPLPELHSQPCKKEADVVIARQSLAHLPASPGLTATDSGALLTIPGVARFTIDGGRRIAVDPAAGASDRQVRLYLIGSAMGALLHQRGQLPLHGNAVVVCGFAAIVLGPSGSGKSTIAAWFHDRGFGVLADDVCAVGFEADLRAVVYPGVPRLKLWRDAVEASGRDPGNHDRVIEGSEKYVVPTKDQGHHRPLPLGAIYVLRDAKTGSDSWIRQLHGAEALKALVSNIYRGEFLQKVGSTEVQFRSCLDLLKICQVYEIGRIWGRDRFEEQMLAVAEHARQAGSHSRVAAGNLASEMAR